MADSIIRPDAEQQHRTPAQLSSGELQPREYSPLGTADSVERIIEEKAMAETISGPEKVIWTPAFILTFALLLVLGLSAESVLAQSWTNGLFPSTQWIIQAHVILVCLAWLTLSIVTSSRWIRIGSIFGCISTAFMTLNITTTVQGIGFDPLVSYINVATCIAMLGAYIGLSVERTLLTTWDIWLFLLTPVLGIIGVTLTYFLVPQASILTVENAVAAAALIACTLFWWLRPSCWKKQPGPTFLFGVVPIILLSAALLNATMNNFFLLYITSPNIDARINSNNGFFAQMALLLLFLGCLRVTKSELRN